MKRNEIQPHSKCFLAKLSDKRVQLCLNVHQLVSCYKQRSLADLNVESASGEVVGES